MTRFLRDGSFSAAFAGFLTVLVSFAATGVMVFQAARAMGAHDAEIASWVWALSISGGITSIVLSLCYRVPVVIAWSTPGLAMLMADTSGLSLAEATGAFLISATLIIIFGFTGWLERVLGRIPIALAAAMIAGIMLQFGLNIFTTMQHHFALGATMLCVWLLVRCWSGRYAMLCSLAAGLIVTVLNHSLHLPKLDFTVTHPVFVFPHFSMTAVLSVAVPLFVVTMASQTLPGVAVLRTYGYSDVPISPIVGWSGVANLLFVPFGSYAITLASNTAALCCGPEAHEDPQRRYMAGVWTGLFFLVVGVFGTTVATLLGSLPQELMFATAGIALFTVLTNALAMALQKEEDREAAFVTFLVTASGLTLLGVGASFWGVVFGLIVLGLSRMRNRLIATRLKTKGDSSP